MSTLKDKLIIIQQARDAIRTALAEKGQVVGKDIIFVIAGNKIKDTEEE